MNNKIIVSKIFLARKSLLVQSDLSNLYDLHRRLRANFPNETQGNTQLLYRIEKSASSLSEEIPILVQSSKLPNWDELGKIPDYFSRKPLIKVFENIDFRRDSSYNFIMCADPSRRSWDNTKRIGLLHDKELTQWIYYKGIKHGFSINKEKLEVKKHPPMKAFLNKTANEESSEFSINIVEYSGLLEVNNPIEFTQALFNGIGPGKIFGCGLLSLYS